MVICRGVRIFEISNIFLIVLAIQNSAPAAILLFELFELFEDGYSQCPIGNDPFRFLICFSPITFILWQSCLSVYAAVANVLAEEYAGCKIEMMYEAEVVAQCCFGLEVWAGSLKNWIRKIFTMQSFRRYIYKENLKLATRRERTLVHQISWASTQVERGKEAGEIASMPFMHKVLSETLWLHESYL